MKMSDSDFDEGLKRVHSRKKALFQVVPKDIDFRIRIVDFNSQPVGFLYTLKAGQSLPYEPDLEGIKAILNFIFILSNDFQDIKLFLVQI